MAWAGFPVPHWVLHLGERGPWAPRGPWAEARPRLPVAERGLGFKAGRVGCCPRLGSRHLALTRWVSLAKGLTLDPCVGSGFLGWPACALLHPGLGAQ